jgi:homogentisate 1,2-dioxygenase
MVRRFSVQRGASRVVFGAGASTRISAEIEALAVERAVVVCSPGRKEEAETIAARLGAHGAGVLATAREHVPIEIVAEARREIEKLGADAALAFGGGSAIGLAKALALSGRARSLAIPTTYSGSEMTPIYGITENGEKKVGRDERVRPVLVVYDPALTVALPRDVTIASLWNAMAHAIEALWSTEADRATMLAAEEGLRLLASSALRLAVRPGDTEAREDALEGAYLAGGAFGDVAPSFAASPQRGLHANLAGLHHKLCHALGGVLGLPHAETHAALLPHVVRFQGTRAPAEAMRAIARALGPIDPVEAIESLARATGAPRGLASLGMKREDIPRVAKDEASAKILEGALSPPPHTAAPPLRAPKSLDPKSGLGATHESEALPGALPRRQNTPHPPPRGLYPELLSGTPFTVKSAENSRVWMYRIRPSFSHGPIEPLPTSRFCAPLGDANPNRARWKPLPIPKEPARVDFLDGLVTLGGAGDPTAGPGYAVHLYAANTDMEDRAFADADGDVLIVPQEGAIDCRTELGWLRAPPGSILLVPRALKFAIGLPDGCGRGWMLEVFGRRLRLPERGPIGSNGLAEARHFVAPTAAYEDRACRFRIVGKLGGRLGAAWQDHSPFDVVAWHGNHVPYAYDLSLFNAMGTVTFDHPDPSILTVLTAPLDDHGRAIADFVVFPGRWEVSEHSFRPPFMHRNAASEINGVVRVKTVEAGYEPGCTFVSPLLTPHGVTAKAYESVLSQSEEAASKPYRIPDESLWIMFESALAFRETAWARETPLLDGEFLKLFEGMRSRMV